MKKTTHRSSPNNCDIDNHRKNGSINKSFARVTPLRELFYDGQPKSFIYEPKQQVSCLMEYFLNHGLLPTVMDTNLLQQFLLIECSVGCSHYVDISQHMHELEVAGHPIGNLRMWSPGSPIHEVYSYIDPTRSAAND